MVAATAAPSVPSAGNGVSFARDVSGAVMPSFQGPDGRPFALQPWIGQKLVAIWSPLFSNATTTGAQFGFYTLGLGTFAARNFATTNAFAAMRRIGNVSAATAGSRAGAYTAVNWWRGNAAGLGGFRAVFRFGISDASLVGTANTFVGFAASSTVGSGNSDPSGSLNIVGIGADIADTNMQIMVNDGTGAATKINLGANFPANTTNVDAYELALYTPPNGTSIGYRVTRLNTGDVATGTLSTDLPVSTLGLNAIFMRGNTTTAAVVALDILSMYIESEN